MSDICENQMRKIQKCFAIYSKGITLVCNGCDVIGRAKNKASWQRLV